MGGRAPGFGIALGLEGILLLLGLGLAPSWQNRCHMHPRLGWGIGVCGPRLHDGLLHVCDTGVIQPYIECFECVLGWPV